MRKLTGFLEDLEREIAIVRIGDRRERQLALIGEHRLDRGVEDHHFKDAGSLDLLVALNHRTQVGVADRTAREASR